MILKILFEHVRIDDLLLCIHRDESKFIEDVLNKLDCKCFHVSKHMIGVDSGLLLEIATKDVHVVGIYGMEGVGKTPTTESVFNRLC